MSPFRSQVFPLGFQWPVFDPFLFCVHHDDAYPAGNSALGPEAPLDGRQMGNDFEPVDGWRMYHGQVVPGFPQHPHRGFETVTYVRSGLVDHSDSLGAAARYGRGDVQWLTAGAGIVHAEMFPLVFPDRPNPLELFQIWLNLPAADKLAEPHFAMLWDEDVPRVRHLDEAGRLTEITVVAGPVQGAAPPSPPPASWAAKADSEVAIWHVRVESEGRWVMPPSNGSDTVRTLYVFSDGGVILDGERLAGHSGVVVTCTAPLALYAPDGADVLVLQGRPIGEPVAQYGPFVMNTRAEIEQAFADYRRTGFGGWPWPVDDPVHGADPARFARTASGESRPVGDTGPR